tara:strand:- start:624 stop:1871 length:1248 start_codon:yes stop_codon:yes gene_type:complete
MSWKNPSSWGKDIVNAAEGATSATVGWVDDTIIKPTANYTEDAYKDASKAATDAYNYSYSIASSVEATKEVVSKNITKSSEEFVKQGVNTATKEWKEGSKLAEDAYELGTEAAVKYGTEAYEWLEANACHLSLNFGLSTACVLYFTPKGPEDPSTYTTTAMSVAAAGATLIATSAAYYGAAVVISAGITPIIYEIPGVKGQISRSMLDACITNSVCNSLQCSALWCTPFGVGIAISTLLCPIIASLICDGILPAGYGMIRSADDTAVNNMFSANGNKQNIINRGTLENNCVAVRRVENKNYCQFMNNNSIWPIDNREVWDGSLVFSVPIDGYYTVATAVDNECSIFIDNNKILAFTDFKRTAQIKHWMVKGKHTVSWNAKNYKGKASSKNPAGLSLIIESDMDKVDISAAIKNGA